MLFPTDLEDAVMLANRNEREARDQFLHTLATDPAGANRLASVISAWGNSAPSLPTGAVWGLANAGISPDHPVGQQIISKGLSLLPQPSPYQTRLMSTAQARNADMDMIDQARGAQDQAVGLPPGLSSEAVAGPQATISQSNPAAFTQTADMSTKQDTGFFSNPLGFAENQASNLGHFATAARSDIAAPINRLIEGGTAQVPGGAPVARSEAGLGDKEVGKGIIREAGAVANTGLQAVEVPVRAAAAITAQATGHHDFTSPLFGTQWHIGSIGDAFSPDQFTLYQQIAHGKSLGTGFLPGGEATQAATQAQQQAASVNGHALTYGRSIASVVASPDTRPFNIVSGLSDFTVAMEGDPAAWLGRTVSDSTAASHIFSETTDASRAAVADELIAGANSPEQIAGLEHWAGGGEHGAEELRNSGTGLREAVIDRMRTDPLGMATTAETLGISTPRELMRAAKAPQTGIFMGLRPILHRDSVLSYALSDQSTKDFAKIVAEDSFTKLRERMPNVPVETVSQLAKARSVEDVRFLLNDEMGLSVPGPGVNAIRPWEDSRLAAMLPPHFADLTDKDQAVEALDRQFRAANVPRDVRDEILTKLADSRTQGEAWDAYVNDGSNAIAARLAQDDRIGGIISAPGIPMDEAKKLTRFYADQSAEQHLYNMDESGRNARVTVGTVNGEPVGLSGPHLETELGRFVPSLDPVALRQATTKWRQAIHLWHDGYVTDAEGFAGNASRVAHQAARAERYVLGAITGIWKTGVLATLRLPVRIGAEEQAAASVAGLDSLWTNPASTLSLIAGAKEGKLADFLERLPRVKASGSADVLNREWATFLGDQQSDYSRWLGQVSGAVPSPWSREQQILKRYTMYDRSTPDDYRRGWIDELSHLHLDVPSREVARALLDPENYSPTGIPGHTGLDAVKDWIRAGPGSDYLYEMQTAHSADPDSYIEALRSGQMSPDEWVDSIADRVKVKTAGDEKLLHAVAWNKDPETGDTPFDFARVNQGYKKSTSQEFRGYIRDNMANGPERVRALTAVKNTGRQAGLIQWFGDRMMGALMDEPSRVITRSPMGRQFYYQEVQRMFSQLTPDAQQAALRQAASDGWKLTKTAGSGAADLEHVDMVAKARTLSKLHDYLYYPAEKNTAESMLSNFMPFAGAWHSALRRWSKLTMEHPQILRRVQQGVQQLQSQGVFYKNQDGKEVFGIFGPGIMRELAGATGATMEGPVQGLNILGNGLPGPGLGAQIAAELMVPHISSSVGVRQFVSPYGEPDFSGGWQMFLPGWLQKMSAGQFQPIRSIPGVGEPIAGALTKVFPRSASQTVSVQDLAKQQFAAMVESGSYDFSKPGVFDSLIAKANQQAQSMYFWRGLAQMVIPTAPTYSTKIVPKNGTAAGTGIFLNKIGNDLRAAMQANGNNYDKAFAQIVQKYGPAAMYATEPQNLRTTYGVPTTIEGEAWQNAHPKFVQDYGNVWGYFAPSGGSFNQTVYHDEINKGLIQSTTLAQWAQEANQHLGNLVYNSVRTALGPSVSKGQQASLDQLKAQLAKEYPGYTGNVAGLATKASSAQKIAELGNAVNDPAVRDTPLAKAAKTYMLVRQALLDVNNRKSFTGTKMVSARQQLNDIGTQLVNKVPEFGNLWDGMFSYEVEP